jgi:YesN/AraC family two-component response regulator
VDYISFNFTSLPEHDLPVKIENGASGEVKMLVAACDEILKKHPDGEELAEPLLECVLGLLQSNLKRDKNPSTAQIARFLRENLGQKITLADVGKITFFSPVYCDTVFKKETGKSIVEYLLDERVSEAKKLLLEGVLPLKQIAEQVGFPDYNYFARTFKKRTGFTPLEYRKTVWTR